MSPVPTPPPSEPAPSLRPVEEIDAARLAAMNAWRQAAGALREYLGVPEGAYADGFEVRVGCVVDDLGRMSEAQRRFFLDVVPALLARLRAAEETLAAVGAALHLDDGQPINPPEVPGGYATDYVDGWDWAVDHMRGLVRAALAEGASR